MPPQTVTALIGPSGCGKSTFLRSSTGCTSPVSRRGAGRGGPARRQDIYGPGHRITETRRRIGMVFQKPNPFPAMSIADNVTAGLEADRHAGQPAGDAMTWSRRCLRQGRAVERGQGPARHARAPRSRAASSNGCASPGRSPSVRDGPAHGRALLGARPDLDPADRRDHRRTARRGDHRHRHAQHATGGAGSPSSARSSWPSRERRATDRRDPAPPSRSFDNPRDPRTADYVNGRFG